MMKSASGGQDGVKVAGRCWWSLLLFSLIPNIVSRDSNWTFNFYVGVVN